MAARGRDLPNAAVSQETKEQHIPVAHFDYFFMGDGSDMLYAVAMVDVTTGYLGAWGGAGSWGGVLQKGVYACRLGTPIWLIRTLLM